MRGQEDDLHAVGQARCHQFIALLNVDGDNASGADVAEVFQVGLFDRAVAGGEEDVLAFFFQIADGEHGANGFAWLQRDQATYVFALAGGAHVGDFVHLQPVHASRCW